MLRVLKKNKHKYIINKEIQYKKIFIPTNSSSYMIFLLLSKENTSRERGSLLMI